MWYYRQTDRQTDGWTGRQTDGQTDRYTHRLDGGEAREVGPSVVPMATRENFSFPVAVPRGVGVVAMATWDADSSAPAALVATETVAMEAKTEAAGFAGHVTFAAMATEVVAVVVVGPVLPFC